MKKYKVIRKITNFEVGEIVYINFKYPYNLIYKNPTDENFISRADKSDLYNFLNIDDICEQSKKLEIGKEYHYQDLCILLNEKPLPYQYDSQERISQMEKWKIFFDWDLGNKRCKHIITKINNNVKSFVEEYNSFEKELDYLENKCGVYIIKFDDSLPYIGQSTNLKARLISHKENYKNFEFEILEILEDVENIKSKYILSTVLIYLEGKYIEQYGLENLKNKENTYQYCYDIRKPNTIYSMGDCTKEITYNLFSELSIYNNDIIQFLDSCKDYNLSNIINLKHFQNDNLIEYRKKLICELCDIDLNVCDKYYQEFNIMINNFFVDNDNKLMEVL